MVIYEKKDLAAVEDRLLHLSTRYIDDPIDFYYVQKENIEYPNIFEDGHVKEFPAVFIIRGKRNKYTIFEGQDFHVNKLETFVEDILGGGGQYTQLYDEFRGNVFDDQKTDL